MTRKLIQIAVAASEDEASRTLYLYALDSSGQLWEQQNHAGEWLPTKLPPGCFVETEKECR